jgi:hypothetical protein
MQKSIQPVGFWVIFVRSYFSRFASVKYAAYDDMLDNTQIQYKALLK